RVYLGLARCWELRAQLLDLVPRPLDLSGSGEALGHQLRPLRHQSDPSCASCSTPTTPRVAATASRMTLFIDGAAGGLGVAPAPVPMPKLPTGCSGSSSAATERPDARRIASLKLWNWPRSLRGCGLA